MVQYFFHGGLLPPVWDLHRYPTKDRYNKSKTDMGYGLYVVDHWETARKYQKGNRRFYVVGVEMDSGKDISDVYLDMDLCFRFVMNQFSLRLANEWCDNFVRLSKDGNTLKAEYFDNIIVQYEKTTGRIGKELICFLVNNGVGYRKVFNRFGFGENMLVLYDVRCISSIQALRGKDMVYSVDDYVSKRGL
ncbi:MAG: hypothetical protein KA270_17380 [Saprospiraceae bacterium]|nr:hypothetical protein [Saprospiraceae bacterium]MBP6568951.1 hypothetical protein [Saprospiraceae bacterium]